MPARVEVIEPGGTVKELAAEEERIADGGLRKGAAVGSPDGGPAEAVVGVELGQGAGLGEERYDVAAAVADGAVDALRSAQQHQADDGMPTYQDVQVASEVGG